jgi:hypothetical protein
MSKIVSVWLDAERDPTSPIMMERYPILKTRQWKWIKQTVQVKPLIKKGLVDFLSMDSTLGRGKEESFELADWIEEMAYKGKITRFEWNVHASNGDAAKRLKVSLEGAERWWTSRGN